MEWRHLLVSCLVNKCSFAEAALDLVGGFGPAEKVGRGGCSWPGSGGWPAPSARRCRSRRDGWPGW